MSDFRLHVTVVTVDCEVSSLLATCSRGEKNKVADFQHCGIPLKEL